VLGRPVKVVAAEPLSRPVHRELAPAT